ncbi:MAG: peptidoglycan DD-metalloendopeptidase family protein [Gammaproteobacteria bacterium]|nr:peptidoglycan DD-metalloendopeptidase family protein [Gammaproteobacteria bacterium]
MNIIFVGKFRGKPLRCQLDGPRQLIACSLIISLFAGLLVSSGFWYGKTEAAVNELAALQRDISKQKILINEARQSAESELDALAARIGKMQANVIRLNALGQRLVKVAKLDSKEFNFKDTPSYGGPNESESVASMDFDDVIANLDKQLSTREEQLAVLEEVIMSRQLRSESKPRGRPITKGWTSSYYGKRADPFTGKLAMHKGMDFAGKEGSDIVAVASGVVVWAGDRYGYGHLVEINHGNGYSTRYGHNAKLLVKAGDSVEKGQVISQMGSTGRSTGPHVHFEVLKNDRQVNPAKFVALR